MLLLSVHIISVITMQSKCAQFISSQMTNWLFFLFQDMASISEEATGINEQYTVNYMYNVSTNNHIVCLEVLIFYLASCMP